MNGQYGLNGRYGQKWTNQTRFWGKMGKILVIIGLVIVIIGILLIFKVPIPFGRLPGDISFKGEHFQFYFPIVSSIILSIILSLLFYLFGRS